MRTQRHHIGVKCFTWQESMVDRPHYDCDLRFPDRAFIPGRMPHPRRSGANLSEITTFPVVIDPDDGPARRQRALRRGLDLFNHGYFWEAHEAWEEPWQGLRRDSAGALHLQGLIRLAAAALKLVMEEPAGVAAHAGWCAATFTRLHARRPEVFAGGPEAEALIALCRRLHAAREPLTGDNPQRLASVLRLGDVPL
jgi:hypothetical protein